MKESQWEELAPAKWAESLTFSLLRWRWSVFSCLSAPTAPHPLQIKYKWKLSEVLFASPLLLSMWSCTMQETILPVVEQHRIYWDRRIGILFQPSALSRASPSHWCLFARLLLLHIQCGDAVRPLLKGDPHLWWPRCNNDLHILCTAQLLCAPCSDPPERWTGHFTLTK